MVTRVPATAPTSATVPTPSRANEPAVAATRPTPNAAPEQPTAAIVQHHQATAPAAAANGATDEQTINLKNIKQQIYAHVIER